MRTVRCLVLRAVAGVLLATGLTPTSRLFGQKPPSAVAPVSIGSLDGEHDAFAQFTDVLLLGNKLTLVLDRIEQRLVAFDAAGRFLWQYGRAGGGPGEFQWPARLMALSDSTLGIVDVARGRVVELKATAKSGVFVGERPGPVGGMFMCSAAGGLAVAHFSKSGETVAITALANGTRDSVSVLDLATYGPVADDVAVSSPVGCASDGKGWLQVNGSSGEVGFADAAKRRKPPTRIAEFHGFTVKPVRNGVVSITTPPDRHTAPWQVLTLPSGRFVIAMQDRRTVGLNKSRTAPVFETLDTYVHLVTVTDSIRSRRVSTPGIVRAVRDGFAAFEVPGDYPRLVVAPATWAR